MDACLPEFEISEDKMTLEYTEWCVLILKAVKSKEKPLLYP